MSIFSRDRLSIRSFRCFVAVPLESGLGTLAVRVGYLLPFFHVYIPTPAVLRYICRHTLYLNSPYKAKWGGACCTCDELQFTSKSIAIIRHPILSLTTDVILICSRLNVKTTGQHQTRDDCHNCAVCSSLESQLPVCSRLTPGRTIRNIRL